METGQTGWRHLGDFVACAGARAAAINEGKIFAVDDGGRLWRVDPEGGSVATVGDGDWRTRLLAAARGRLYAFDESGPLHAVDPISWHRERLDGDWAEVTSVTGTRDQLFAAGGCLYAVEADGSYHQLGENVWRPRLLLGSARNLFCLEENGGLYRVALEDASSEQLDGDWADVAAGVALDDVLYLASTAGWLYAVGYTGDCIPLDCGAPAATRFLLASGHTLFALEESGALHALDLE